MSGPADEAALARVPDLPQWVDTRGMLLSRRAIVSFPPIARYDSDGFVIELASRALLSAIDNPPPTLIAERALAMRGDANMLCASDTVSAARSALTGWVERGVRLYALHGIMPWEDLPDDAEVSILFREDAPSLAHVPEDLRHELTDALEGHPAARFVPGVLPEKRAGDASPTPIPMAAAWVHGRPVAFCYPALITETLWDVAVDTLEEFRGRGLAARAARAMVRHMRGHGKAPVWGAVETNAASLSVARQLGFVETGRLTVFAMR
jgi:RimJ/RimL family protein N-acetyltransferase